MATGIGEPDMLITGIGSTALTVLIIMIAIVGWMKSPKQDREDVKNYLRDAVSLGHVGEHVSYEDEEDEFENPAIADSMPQPKVRRVPVQVRETPLPRHHFFGTVRRDSQQMAIYTTGRGKRSEGPIVKIGQLGHYLVEKSGNRMWVAE